MDRRAGDLGTVVANAAKAVVCRRRRGELEAKADFGWQTKRGLKEGLGSTICRVGSAKGVFESRVTAKFEFGRPTSCQEMCETAWRWQSNNPYGYEDKEVHAVWF